MQKKASTIIISLSLLAISICLLLVFFLFKPDYQTESLNIMTGDLNLNEGQVKYDFYTISQDGASIEISTDVEGIVEVNKDYIKGIKAGKVSVTIIARKDNMIAKATFNVYVYSEGYTYDIIPLSNCEYNGEKLLISDQVSQFQFILYDKIGQPIQNESFSLSATNEAIINQQFQVMVLKTSKDCMITINYENLNFVVIIFVEVL